MSKAKKVVLAIIDGWGNGPDDKYNAIKNAVTPYTDKLQEKYPTTELLCGGNSVGLPEGMAGTSEVNHLTIGAGRTMLQELPRINQAIDDLSFFNNAVINASIDHAIERGTQLHLIGIVSQGGVHSHFNHIMSILQICATKNFKDVRLHVFTDGRDTPPQNAEKQVQVVQDKMDELGVGTIDTLQGRIWLDRDREWDRTEKCFQLIGHGKGEQSESWYHAIQDGYEKHHTSEYFDQYVVNPEHHIKDGDAVFFFHFRSGRMYQLTKRILDEKYKDLYFGSFVECAEEFKVGIAFPREKIAGTLAEVISKHNKRQLHITETEKFPHLTYYLNGEHENEWPGEDWQLIESNRFIKPRYNLEPTMRAYDITRSVLSHLEKGTYDFIVINYPNTDMVGHTGNYSAAVIAAEAVDYCIHLIHEQLKDKLDEYAFVVTADHGNSDQMWDYENNQPHTRHTLNPVPITLITNDAPQLTPGLTVASIGTMVLDLMGLPQAEQMDAPSLIQTSEN